MSDTNKFKEGDKVTYVPSHAKGDTRHEDCESGVVSSTNDHYVFVRFGSSTTSQACRPEDLVKG